MPKIHYRHHDTHSSGRSICGRRVPDARMVDFDEPEDVDLHCGYCFAIRDRWEQLANGTTNFETAEAAMEAFRKADPCGVFLCSQIPEECRIFHTVRGPRYVWLCVPCCTRADLSLLRTGLPDVSVMLLDVQVDDADREAFWQAYKDRNQGELDK